MANKIVGTNGDDVLKGTKKKDIIKGKGGNDVIKGKAGNDVLKGGKGDDELKGAKGDDKLKGGKGDDLLIGGKGADYQWGGDGADIFKFKAGDGFNTGFPGLPASTIFDDVVFDFQDGKDKFDIPVVGGFGGPLLDGDTGLMGTGVIYSNGVAGVGSFFVPLPGGALIDLTDFI